MEKAQLTVHQGLEIGLLFVITVLQLLILFRLPSKVPTLGEFRASTGNGRRELLLRRPMLYVEGSVEVPNEVNVRVADTVDVNLKEVVGNELVSSERGMFIGVESTKKTIIPIHWGEVSVGP